MPYYLTHPEHGTHICYTLEDVEAHKAIGWSDKSEETQEPQQEPQKATVKKTGRPPKVKNGNINIQ